MPGFGERTFEFCYNAEFCKRFQARLAAAPNIPSLRAERELGYDVEFLLDSGSYKRSLFLQHKVTHFAERRVGSNVQFYDQYKGPYYRFLIDKEQQNTLVGRYDPSLGAWFYCAPRFHRATELEDHFRNLRIYPNCVWVRPSDIGAISDNKTHNVTFDKSAIRGRFHSEPAEVRLIHAGDELPVHLPELEVSKAGTQELLNRMLGHFEQSDMQQSVPDEYKNAKPIERLQYLIGHQLGLSWLLLPAT